MQKLHSRAGGLMESLGGVSNFDKVAPKALTPLSESAPKPKVAPYSEKVQTMILNALKSQPAGTATLSMSDLGDTQGLFRVDHMDIARGCKALERDGKIRIDSGIDEETYVTLAENPLTESADFTTNDEMVEYISKGIPKAIREKGNFYVRAESSLGGGQNMVIKYVSNDFRENPKLNNIEHNALHRFIFMMHQSPETPTARFPLKFEIVTGVSYKLKGQMKNPRLVKQKTFRAAADKIIAWFKKEEDRLLDWSEGL